MSDYVVDVDGALAFGRAHAQAAAELAALGLGQLSVADDASFVAAAAFLGVDGARSTVGAVRGLVGSAARTVDDLLRIEALVARRVAAVTAAETVSLAAGAAIGVYDTAVPALRTAGEVALTLYDYDPPAPVPAGLRGPDGKPLDASPLRTTTLDVAGAGYVPFRVASAMGSVRTTWVVEEYGPGQYRLHLHLTVLGGAAEGAAADKTAAELSLGIGGDSDLYWDLSSRDDAETLARRLAFELAGQLGGNAGRLANGLGYALHGRDWRIPAPTGGDAGLVVRGDGSVSATELTAVAGVLNRALGSMGAPISVQEASGKVSDQVEGGTFVEFKPADAPRAGRIVTAYQRLGGQVTGELDVATAARDLRLPIPVSEHHKGELTLGAEVKADPVSREVEVKLTVEGKVTVTDALKADLPKAASAEVQTGAQLTLSGEATVSVDAAEARRLEAVAHDPQALVRELGSRVEWKVDAYDGTVAGASIDASDLGGGRAGKAGFTASVDYSDLRLVHTWSSPGS